MTKRPTVARVLHLLDWTPGTPTARRGMIDAAMTIRARLDRVERWDYERRCVESRHPLPRRQAYRYERQWHEAVDRATTARQEALARLGHRPSPSLADAIDAGIRVLRDEAGIEVAQ